MFETPPRNPNHPLPNPRFPLRHIRILKPSMPLHPQPQLHHPPFPPRKRRRLGLRLLPPHRPMRLRVRTNLRLLTPPSSLSLPLFSHPLRLSLSLSKPKAPPRSLRLRHQQHGFRSRRSLLLQALPHRLEGPPNSASGHRFLLL